MKSVVGYGFVTTFCVSHGSPGSPYQMVVSAVSPRVPIHWMTIVVVGSRNQVRKSVFGTKA